MTGGGNMAWIANYVASLAAITIATVSENGIMQTIRPANRE